MNFLHTFSPNPILIQFGSLKIHYYGLFIVLGIIAASFVALKLAKHYHISQNDIIDSAFYSIIFGIIGTRIYHVFLELPYYLAHPLNVFKIWNGGLAIHGGIIAGIFALLYFAKKKKINFITLTSIYVPALALAQAIGRIGNYFNQELYGLPTALPWGIPINIENRIADFIDEKFFHPTFLYESLGNLFIFAILLLIHKKIFLTQSEKIKIYYQKIIIISYLSAYSLLRFSLEFLRIDITPDFVGLRVPQLMSVALIAISLLYFIKIKKEKST